MKNTPWLWPVLGVATAILAVAASYLILRFSPSPFAVATVVVAALLIALATFGILATRQGQAATFVAIALVLPYLLIGTTMYATAERASSELSSIFDEDGESSTFDDDEFFGDDESFDEDGAAYGSDPELDALQDECVAGDEQACNDLYQQSPLGSEYEATAQEHGGGF